MAATRQKAKSAKPSPPAKRPRGKPPTITLANVQHVASLIAQGVPARYATAGVCTETYWCELLVKRPDYGEIVAHAKQTFIEEATARIKAGDKGWQGPAWLLERRYVEDFGIKIQPNVQVNVGIGIMGEQVAQIQQIARQKFGTSRSQKGKLAAEWQQDGEVVEAESGVSHSESGAQPGTPDPRAGEPTTPDQGGEAKPAEGEEW